MRRILVVEDNPDLADLVTLNLRDEGYAVENIGDGSLALAKLQAEPYDLVILDLMLPGMDGLMAVQSAPQPPRLLTDPDANCKIDGTRSCSGAGSGRR